LGEKILRKKIGRRDPSLEPPLEPLLAACSCSGPYGKSF